MKMKLIQLPLSQIINLGETILPSMGIKALSGEWFYDNVTPRGVSFDAFLPQACKTPLGNMEDFELIHCPATMAEFQSNSWYQKNPGLGEILLTVAPLDSDEHRMTDQYRLQLEKYLCSPCDSENCPNHNPNDNPPRSGVCRGVTALRKDFFRYEKMLPSINEWNEDGKLFDVKKEIYRLVDRVFAGLAACFEIRANGAFKILDELEMKRIITCAGRENLVSAAGIALELRIRTYLEAGKQGEQVIAKSSSKEKVSKFESFSCLLNEEELFHIFLVATPLYEEIRRCCVLDGQIPSSFAQQAFFDCSFAVKGHIYRRAIKYEQALDCYERALKTNPENIEMQLCLIDIQLEIDRSAEMASCIDNKLETLIRVVCKKHNLPGEIVDQRGHFVPIIDGNIKSLHHESAWELLNILQSIRCFHFSQGNIELAELVFDQAMALSATFDKFENFMVYFTCADMTEQLRPEQSENFFSFLKKVVEEEGICTRSIVCLNELGKSLLSQEKFQQAYQCLLRALAMERTLYISNFNPHIQITLTLLGVVAVELEMYEEGKLFHKQLLQLRESLNVASDTTLDAKAHLSLACLCAITGHHEEAISYFQDLLDLLTSATYKRESFLECITHCQLAFSWHALNENEKALKSAMDAKECLTSITSVKMKVSLTCEVAEVFRRIERHEDAVSLVMKGLKEVDSEQEMKHKAEYLKFLGEVYVQQGLASQAELYYKETLDCLMISEENTCAIVECLLELCNILLEKGDSSEVKSKLEDAWKYASRVTEDRKLCYYIRKFGKCWEKLGDVNQALIWYGEVLVEYTKSGAQVNVPLFEFELHVKLGDMTDLYLSSIDSGVSLSPEQRQNAQRVHYDRAGKVLRRYTSLGNVNPTTTQLFVLLASRYRSIDLAEEEALLFGALEMCKAINETNKTCEIEAATLTGLSDIKWLTGDYVSASGFLERSLKKEMELYSSAPNYTHIPDLLFRLTRFHLKGTDDEQLREVTQRALEFVDVVEEEIFAKNITKKNAAMCFWSASIFYLSLRDGGKVQCALERANKLFEEVEEDFALNDNKQQGSSCKEPLFPEYPYILYTEDLISTVLIPLVFPGATKSLLDILSLVGESSVSGALGTSSDETEIAEDEERTKRSSRTDTMSSDPNVATLLRIIPKFFHLIPSSRTIRDSCLEPQNANFPLSASNLDNLYIELDKWAPAQEYSENVKTSVPPLSGEPSESFNYAPLTQSSSALSSNAQAELEGEHDSRVPIVDFLEMLQVQKGFFDKPFVTQKAFLQQFPIADDYFVYDTLGMLLSARGNIDGAIKCYEHCLDLNEDHSYGQDFVATLAELYQVKAVTALSEGNASYTSWMKAAQECFDRLRLKTEKLNSFVARAFGSFLCRQERFEEAISQFKTVLEENDETEITLTFEDKSLVSVYLEREIEARGEVNLPLKILVYHEMVSAYWKLNEVENAQQSVHQMEKQVNLFQSIPEYPLILSVLGYTHKEIGNKKRAADIFLSVLLMNPGHTPVVVALETNL